MTYELFIGGRTYSSWSMRGWLMFENFNLPCKTRMVGIYDGTKAADLAGLEPALSVPVMRTPDGIVIGDSLPIAETLAERHPNAGLWPTDPAARGLARWLVAEMHSGFGGLRDACAMQLMHQYIGFEVSDAVRTDLNRLEYLWGRARADFGDAGPWLFGNYCLADAFFAPVAARIAGYDLTVGADAQTYVALHLGDGAFRRWRAMGAAKIYTERPYAMDLEHRPWPGPGRLPADAVTHGPSENATCPYSDDPVVAFLELDGRVFGFCNDFCRDKTVADPGAWPAFMDIYGVGSEADKLRTPRGGKPN